MYVYPYLLSISPTPTHVMYIHRPGLPDNIVALGDPGSVAHPILDIEEVPTWSHSLHLETLEDDELGQLIREYIPGSSNTERYV